jgi:hypothetical protein
MNPFDDIEESSFNFDPETTVEKKREADDRSLVWSSPIIIE